LRVVPDKDQAFWETLMVSNLADSAVRKAAKRLIWFLIALYFFAVLDRVNVSFAALSMNKDLGLTAEMFGFGATMFLVGYVIFEIPSNLILERVGARLWLARIALTWGLATTLMAFAQGPASFYALRFLVGAAEAGCLPGILYFMTAWFPQQYRGRFNSFFFLSIPITNALSAPFSASVLGLHGVIGLAGWQWLFVIEGLLTASIGIGAWLWLQNRPSEATWLSPAERTALQQVLDAERDARVKVRHLTVKDCLTNPIVIALAVAYVGINLQLNTAAFWFPQIFKSLGLENWQIGLATATPFACGSVAMIFWGRRSDRAGERIMHTVAGVLLSSAGWIAAAFATTPVMMVLSLSLAAMGFFSAMTVFWTIPSRLLTGAAAAAGIALTSAMGNLGSALVAPVVGRLRDATGAWTYSFLFVACMTLIAPLILLTFRKKLDPRNTTVGTATSLNY
jgi:ACS family tartrate transporter-like MFS transporter